MSRSGPLKNNAKISNPILRIPFSSSDLGSIEGGGGGGKVLADVTVKYRQNLVSNLRVTRDYLESELSHYPGSMATIVFKLRESAIAKSHRPTKLAREAGLQISGHGKINEMLVAAHAGSFIALESVILSRGIKEIIANLSAIESIEAWDNHRKTPDGLDVLIASKNILIRLFTYTGDDASRSNYKSVTTLIEQSGVEFNLLTQTRGLPLIRLIGISDENQKVINDLISHPGVRSLIPEPKYTSFPVSAITQSGYAVNSFPPPISGDLPTVAVFDTGVSPLALSLSPWISSSETYVIPPDTQYEHGTMVASLVAGAKLINNMHPLLPSSSCLVHDVCALEENGSYITDLEVRLSDAVSKRPDIKIWNLSLGGQPCNQNSFSDFAMTLDRLSDQFDVLFIVAAGNYVDFPRRAWPNPAELDGTDLVSTPGEAVRALTVGAISHIDSQDSLSTIGTPTPYSRRGPGPVFTPKPDVTHAGGGVHSPWDTGSSSLNVICPDNSLNTSFGTSFASPIVASLAAHTWQKISTSPDFNISPSLVKALLIHSAQLSSPNYSTIERRYFGSGLPQEVVNTLHDTDNRFTLIFQTKLVPGMRWRKDNYPIPASLIENGKFKGEIIITAVYAPPLDPNSGSEYVRANVELSFGVIDNNTMKGKVPMEGEDGQSGYETAQIEHGGKWSPVKIHRKIFPKGTADGNWAIQAKATLRANEPALREALPVSIIVTLRALDENPNVYADGVRAVNACNWVNTALPVRVPITV